MDTSRTAIESRLAPSASRCGEVGLALTPQRLAIYQILASDAAHPGAEDIYRRIKPDLPSLSLGTVYRTLDLFRAAPTGLARPRLQRSDALRRQSR